MKTLIIIVSFIALAAVAGAIITGIQSFDGLVTEHPYEQGLAWDTIQNKKDALGWIIAINNSDLTVGGNNIEISILDQHGMPPAISSIDIMIGRASTMTYDTYFDTIKISGGVFAADINFPFSGYWDIKIHVTRPDDTLLFEKRVFVEKEGDYS